MNGLAAVLEAIGTTLEADTILKFSNEGINWQLRIIRVFEDTCEVHIHVEILTGPPGLINEIRAVVIPKDRVADPPVYH